MATDSSIAQKPPRQCSEQAPVAVVHPAAVVPQAHHNNARPVLRNLKTRIPLLQSSETIKGATNTASRSDDLCQPRAEPWVLICQPRASSGGHDRPRRGARNTGYHEHRVAKRRPMPAQGEALVLIAAQGSPGWAWPTRQPAP